MTENEKYPEWQNKHRIAQAEKKAKEAEKHRKAEEDKEQQRKQEELRLEQDFKKAMALLHLPEPPRGTSLLHDGYVFKLGYYKDWSSKPTVWQKGAPVEEHPADLQSFCITITKPLPEAITQEDCDDYANSDVDVYDRSDRWPLREIEFRDMKIGSELSPSSLGEVADALDFLDEQCPKFTDDVRAWKIQREVDRKRWEADEKREVEYESRTAEGIIQTREQKIASLMEQLFELLLPEREF